MQYVYSYHAYVCNCIDKMDIGNVLQKNATEDALSNYFVKQIYKWYASKKNNTICHNLLQYKRMVFLHYAFSYDSLMHI